MPRGDDNFLGRWSRRKRSVKEGVPLEDRPEDEPRPGRMITSAPLEDTVEGSAAGSGGDAGGTNLKPADDATMEAGPDAAREPQEQLSAEDLAATDFDALSADSDYTRFMQEGVPSNIRNKALRKLWMSEAGFGHMDGLDDYAEDFTDAVWVVENLQTSYKVGQGFMTDEELAAQEKLGHPPDTDGDQGEAAGTLTFAPESPDQRDIAAMLAACNAYYDELYPPAGCCRLAGVDALMAPHVRFMVARSNGQAVGCGALELGNDDYAELKRMWIVPQARGKGSGRQLLAQLEAVARDNHVAIVRLQTGVRQPEALALYRAAGYNACPPFGSHEEDELTIFMEKYLEQGSAGST